MSLEDLTGTSKYLSDLVKTNPVGSTDAKSYGDDHIRGIKNVLLNTFPNLTGAVNASQAELNLLVGQTAITNANTAGAIVKRDASGNFSAGNVSANLTGNVTGNVTGDLTGTASAAPWSGITDKPSTFTPASHLHPESQITGYAYTSGAANGDFTSGTIYFVRLGRLVVMAWEVLAHSSLSTPTTSTTFVPPLFRPVYSVRTVYSLGVLRNKQVIVSTGGQVIFRYRDHTGNYSADTDTDPGTIAWITA